MTEFVLRLADIPLLVRCTHEHSREFCTDYLCSDAPQAELEITEQDISEERIRAAAELEQEGLPPREYSDEYLETIAIYRKAVGELLRFGVLLFHGSAVAFDGRVYIFAARSGTGKTTHTRLWLKNIPGCYVLNGDKPLLKFTEGGIYACGTPWQGKEHYGTCGILPLEAVCLLDRGEHNIIESISFRDAFTRLLNQTHIVPGEEAECLKLFGRLSELKLYRLSCNMEDSAAEVSFRGMCRE